MTTTTAVPADTKTTALARFEDVRQIMTDYTPDKYIPLIPTVDMERSPLFRPAVMVVPVYPRDKRDVYPSPAQDGTVCLRARKLEQIGNAIGVKWHDVKIDRDEKRVTATVYAEYTDAVGDRIPLSAAATEYLTPAKGRTVSTYPDEKAQARARAILVKKLTGLPTSFAPAELETKSFVGLRWVLDDRQPDIRDAVINRGRAEAQRVFGRAAPERAIDAGHAEPEEEIVETRGGSSDVDAPEGTRDRQSAAAPTAEAPGSTPGPRSEDPEPVEEAPAKPAVDEERARAIAAHVEKLRSGLRWGKDAREKQPSAQQAGASVTAIVAAVTPSKQQLNVEQKKALWRAVAEFLFGSFGGYDELHSDQVSTLIDWSKNHAGEVRELVAFLAQRNERIAEIHTALEGQQTLVEGA